MAGMIEVDAIVNVNERYVQIELNRSALEKRKDN